MADSPSEALLSWLRDLIKRKGLNTAAVAERAHLPRARVRKLLAGTEPDSWLEDNDKFEERTVEWALELDPSLIAILGAPADSSFERDAINAEWAELEEG